MSETPDNLRILLHRIRDGDDDARHEVFERMYEKLRALAKAKMAGQIASHTLQTTALVHEAFLRLDPHLNRLEDQRHLLAIAARSMRSVLVDYARKTLADKRPNPARRCQLDDIVDQCQSQAIDLLDLGAAMKKLEQLDPTASQLVDLRFVMGHTMAEAAQLLEISERQAYRRWDIARAFLHREVGDS